MNCALCGKRAAYHWWVAAWLCGDSAGKTGCARAWMTSPENARAAEQVKSPDKPKGERWDVGQWLEQPPHINGNGYDFYDSFVPQLRSFVERMQRSGWRQRVSP